MTGIALVTGGARGIGRAIVDRLLRDGWTVALTHVPGVEPPEPLLADLAGRPATLHPLDLRLPASIAACLAEVAARHGGIDALVNNAAVGTATVAAFTESEDQRDGVMLAINAAGTLAMCRGFLAATGTTGRARRIVNLSSVGGGIATFPGFSLADGMSKSAVAHLTRQLAAELVHDPVDVFAICPGATDTEMFRQSTLNQMSPADRDRFIAGLPKSRLIQPDEIATLAAFLVSPASTVLHGAVIDASMGLGVRPGLISETRH
ncbi:MAG: SDR family oxidoreductase [Tabrizicola sp.]|uniref:SDR family NAD(P)-dependent oxidoreductase n=1 Tax=Tabrizicola sp. TaxID=2005166 RepID=UPI002AB930E3|nr:SDR family oxidoreductase [Tabrizicola sp.]MDZ4086184.1 SDR family oxidoreductase [Tabrizicola sp.]